MGNARFVVAVEAAVYHNGRYLFVLRSRTDADSPGVLALPAGTVEAEPPGEGILEATVRREVMEETGVDIEPSSPVYLHSKTFSLSEDRPVVDAVFLCRYRAGDARPDGVEIEEALWLTPAELATRDDAAGWLRRSVALCEAKREELGWD